MEKSTTIRLHPNVKELLDDLKLHPKESYNDVVKRIAEGKKEYIPMFPEEIPQEIVSHISDVDAWITARVIKDKKILDALGRK